VFRSQALSPSLCTFVESFRVDPILDSGRTCYDHYDDMCDPLEVNGCDNVWCDNFTVRAQALVSGRLIKRWTSECTTGNGTFFALEDSDQVSQPSDANYETQSGSWRYYQEGSKDVYQDVRSATCTFRAQTWKGNWIDPTPRIKIKIRPGESLCDYLRRGDSDTGIDWDREGDFMGRLCDTRMSHVRQTAVSSLPF